MEFQPFDISSHAGLLAKGKNVLAIHGLNHDTTSSDMLIVAELVYANDEESGTSLPICEPPAERTPESILLAGRLAKRAPDSKVYFVWGKTGTLRNNHNYSGYIITDKNRRYIFSIMINHFTNDLSKIKEAIVDFLTYLKSNS